MLQTKTSAVKFDWVIPSLRDSVVQRTDINGFVYNAYELQGDAPIVGSVNIVQLDKKPVSHEGITIDLIGLVMLQNNKNIQFFTKTVNVVNQGQVTGSQLCPFDFTGTKLPAESVDLQTGIFKVKYYLVCTMKQKNAKNNIVASQELVYMEALDKPVDLPHKSEVGAENALQVEIECPNTNLDVTCDILYGKVHFVTAQKKMEEMKVQIKRRDGYRMTANDVPILTDWFDLYNYQIMDGAPVRNEIIPFKIRLDQISNITPSFKTDLVKVEYCLLICVIDTDGQSYYKDVPLIFYRGK
ncbi:Vacuolar_protein sorting 26 [Hexamita inflata]|uniref:Vacuolar protein sorting 26 n=1 Tax=Hexamita inflata TaxID=28002 RepID=A0AA86U905_9EUKA|nr:Vacuolar protein sorting 26 [Hexamita inflata]CAI9974062.1 Vacuolar protein sorting 26 [Hexamita inflata]